ncbi:YphA family membrane protein [Bacillus sp. FJAT-29937]|uniref:YphA family membrane protein n=1 Tax=Bacillus sp. FJAT-29937 TaxID=1720553 RepID=UPI00082F2F0E|nr:hypothetical protein [Bacillus sp. FJAT-29937]
MEGLTFYWLAWFFWVIATFFLKKDSFIRICSSLWLLVLIIISPYSFFLFNYEITYVSILFAGTLLVIISRFKRLTAAYVLLSSFIVMIAYVCFHLFALFDPVWLIFPRKWMLALFMIVLAIVLHSNKMYRLITILFGSIQGEFLYAYILNKYSFPHVIGSNAYLDGIMLSAALLGAWSCFEYLTSFYEKHINQVEKEKGKQKLS